MLVLSHAVSSAGLSDVATVKLQEALAGLSMSLSACDRILNTPIPLSYTRQVGRRWLHKDVTSLTCQD